MNATPRAGRAVRGRMADRGLLLLFRYELQRQLSEIAHAVEGGGVGIVLIGGVDA